MYKIYVNGNPLLILSKHDLSKIKQHEDGKIKLFKNKKKQLRKSIKQLQQKQFSYIIILHQKPEEVMAKLRKVVQPIEAAGGLIHNKRGEYFFIYRRGHWDLPKGKIDKGETKKQTAIREVFEETGIKAKIIAPLTTTYHTYVYRDQPALKVSYWFLMTTQQMKFSLQYEEDIEEAQWLTLEEAQSLRPIYPNIKEVMQVIMQRSGSKSR